ncbi:L-lysine 2,3-aminomutase [Psilocybe cubensis]|uniref:L-lysine 2,3-aminomutase n=1 Tax=Psilocybe cubensis TaxID=181762 RepID=A0ACB8GFS4_PSICU|nr:L-lysine 2,3-aminomutase [Psilocybe cubensis]KAH9474387.1 L-lysine 2,3-aminomutase [Psilocybe cubensis]
MATLDMFQHPSSATFAKTSSQRRATALPSEHHAFPDAPENGRFIGNFGDSAIKHHTEHLLGSESDLIHYPYWTNIPLWKEVTHKEFLNYQWQLSNSVQGEKKLREFLSVVLPPSIPPSRTALPHIIGINTPEAFIDSVSDAISRAPMAIRLTPHILSVIDWTNPIDDPVRRQFIPMGNELIPDHHKLKLDSLNEEHDSPVKGLVHRYPTKALFLATSVCNVYCRFCTRSYAVGANTSTVTKNSLKPTKRRWDEVFNYIEKTPKLNDIVVSGGDSFYLSPEQLYDIGNRLLAIPHIRRFRYATKGLAVCPSRILDPHDPWSAALIEISNKGKKMGKAVAMHTHFNHPNEITWVTKLAAQKLFENGVTVRNQTVLLRGVNDSVDVMKKLICDLADINILPYYVYQGDMVRGVEDLRTPLSTILELETQIRGSIGGFMMPQFIVDLPGGGGKRLASSYQKYDRTTGISQFVAPAVTGGLNKVFEYHDPVWSLPDSSE